MKQHSHPESDPGTTRKAAISRRTAVDREAYKAMLGVAMTCTHDQVARQIFIAIQEGRIPHVSIGY